MVKWKEGFGESVVKILVDKLEYIKCDVFTVYTIHNIEYTIFIF